MKYSFTSKAEVYNALHKLFEEGGAALNFRKSLQPIKNQEIYFNSTFFLLEQLSLTQKSSWKIRSKQMSVDTTYFLQETKSSRNLQRLRLVKELMHSTWY